VVIVAVLLGAGLVAGCSGGETAPTPKPIIEGNAVQIFTREAYREAWFTPSDKIAITSEPLAFDQALARAEALGMQLYPTLPGEPPYPDGWLITAKGDFFAPAQGQTPSASAPRRPAVAAAFVEHASRLTYSMRYTD